ncbi:MAG: hypothetical protein ACLRSL_07365 [Streptococcus sp.]
MEQVLFFPEGQAPQSLAFEREGDTVIFTAPHFTHYAIVYKSAKTEGPDQPIQPEEPAKPDQPVQPEDLLNRINQRHQINQFSRRIQQTRTTGWQSTDTRAIESDETN